MGVRFWMRSMVVVVVGHLRERAGGPFFGSMMNARRIVYVCVSIDSM